TLLALKKVISSQAPGLGIFSRSAKEIILSMERQGHTFTLLLTTIGAISLIVGGIGIMNVMLVSLSERKQEIGIRKAIGATNQDIQHLFLIEATLLSCVGGLLGVFVGVAVTAGVAFVNHWNFTLFLSPLCSGFGVSVLTGLFFGFYPARRAAKLDTVISLRGIL
ncbi:MAG: ABC transporter permease, partial [Legionellaceae bacterium]